MNELSKDPDTRKRTIAHQKREAYLLAKARADSYQQRHPGDGFVHELETLGPGQLYGDTKETIIKGHHTMQCPCSQRFTVPIKYRSDRDIQLIQCPACFYWHAITWCVSRSLEALNHFTPRVR